MYESLTVQGFRAFKSFELSSLTRVNLLVGKNNAGKTSLLDAVEMVTLGGRITSLLRSPQRRAEISFESQDERIRRELDVRHLFFGHRIQESTSFEVTACAESMKRRVRCEVRRGQIDQAQLDLLSEQVDLGTPLEIVMSGTDNPEGTPVLPVSPDGSLLEYRRTVMAPAPSGGPPIVWFLGTEGPDARVLQQMWDRLVLTPEEDKVISAMKIIEPSIERLAFARTERMSESVAFIKLADEDQRMPLGSLGDGIKRLLAQAVYMARAAGGVLLIDEIDTGLHYTTLEAMWRLVIESARRLDVQVFATSHSGDCIRSLAWLQTDAPELAAEVSVHRIDRAAPTAVRYSAEDIEIAARHHIEVRG
ncbi:ATP-binding protein [uncultured Thiodictyon sp.]|uniref:AAA family ATPase n=1 Tax=uncultured Thiodictyon sp. TaxID=1846217 RepID=UPI0025F9C8D9|nr:ATP-binding protein [uncultured Thiodictyon sp.]